VLALIGMLSVVSIGLAINDIYNKLDNTTLRLCLVEGWQRVSVQIIARQAGVKIPAFPHPLPPVPKPCTARPGSGR